MVFIPRTLVAYLGPEHGLSMSQNFAMMHVSEAREERLRLGDLADATALSPPAVTRVVTLLEGVDLRTVATILSRVSEDGAIRRPERTDA